MSDQTVLQGKNRDGGKEGGCLPSESGERVKTLVKLYMRKMDSKGMSYIRKSCAAGRERGGGMPLVRSEDHSTGK